MDESLGLDLSITRSCWTCHKKKVRCDKALPCATCVRTNSECTYPELEKKKRPKRLPVSVILNRIAHLEKKISTLSKPGGQPRNKDPLDRRRSGSPTNHELGKEQGGIDALLSSGGQSRYFSDALMASLTIDAKGVDPASESSMLHGDLQSQPDAGGDIKTGLIAKAAPPAPPRLPDAWQFPKLWEIYVKNVDPLLKVLHIPTSKPRIEAALSNPETADDSQAMLLYAICYAATTTLEPSEVYRLLETEKSPLLSRLGSGIEQYLTKFSMIINPSIEYIQALIIHITFLRVTDASRVVWVLTGLAVRIAQSLGLHKDGAKFRLPPFECELRRRLFWHLHVLDIRAMEDYGLQPTTQGPLDDLPLYPLNVNDSNLYPTMTTAPVAGDGLTDMTLALLRIQTTDMVIRAQIYPLDTTDLLGTKAAIENKRRQIHEATDRVFYKYFLQGSDPQNDLYTAAHIFWKLSMAKNEFLLLFRALQHGILDGDDEARKDVLRAACAILDCIPLVYTNSTLKRFSWYPKSYPQYYAIGFVLQQLYQNEIDDAELLDRSRKAVENAFASLEEDEEGGAVQRKGAIWIALRLLKDKAFNKPSLGANASSLSTDPLPGLETPILTSPESSGGYPPSEFDFNSIGNPLFDMVDLDMEGDWPVVDFI